jgi:TPR repeat protein
MKANKLVCVFLFLMLGVACAQQTNSASDAVHNVTFQKWLAQAEKGDAESQWRMGVYYAQWALPVGAESNLVKALVWYRKAADQNFAKAEYNLGNFYSLGRVVEQNPAEAVKWYRKAADQNFANAENNLALCYANGRGVETNMAESVKWYRKAADQNLDLAECNLGVAYQFGRGVETNLVEAVKWYRKAAEQNNAVAQSYLGICYGAGLGVPKNDVEAYKWLMLAVAKGPTNALYNLNHIVHNMTPSEIAEGRSLATAFVLRRFSITNSDGGIETIKGCGSGFFITDDGYLITNNHVVKDATKVRLLTGAGIFTARVVMLDAGWDMALLQILAPPPFAPLPVAEGLDVKLGDMVATVGFPDVGLQGFAPKLSKGEIASLSGAGDDPRYFQISAPAQPGNSGGALVDVRGNVIGIVSAKLDASVALAASGALPENVNYAIKSSLLLSFLKSVPSVSAKLKAPVTADRKFEDVVKSAQDAAVLVLVY